MFAMIRLCAFLGSFSGAVMSVAVEVGLLTDKTGSMQLDWCESAEMLQQRVPIWRHCEWMCSDRRSKCLEHRLTAMSRKQSSSRS